MAQFSRHSKSIAASIPTTRRLPSYLETAKRHLKEGNYTISSTIIADELDLEAIQVRKDLGVTGITGKPRVGYPTGELINAIERFLGWDQNYKAIIVGAGNLGSALMGYMELKDHGLNITAAFDVSEERIGIRKNGTAVYHIDQLIPMAPKMKASLAILTVPSSETQTVCDMIVKAGINQIWNFTNVLPRVPEDVLVLREDLSSGYAVLTAMKSSGNGK